MKVYVTGIGIVSAIGLNGRENFHSLQSMCTGIKRSTEYNLMLAEVKLSDKELVEMLALPELDYSRTTLLSLLAAKEAWGNNVHHPGISTGLISSTSVGGLDRTEKYYMESKKNPSSAMHKLMTHDNGRTTERVAAALGIAGYIGTISTACSSGANAIMHGARLIEANMLHRVLVGGCDPLAHFDINGFSSLNIYDTDICKPFDENRKGLNLGEGAAFLLLESEKSISISGNKPLCTVAGWNNATDAFHQTASSANGYGAYLAMINALAKAKIRPDNISYINAHGTGTGNNDLSESTAIKNVFGDHIPPFSSTKGYTGHTLAAAGAIEAVFCVQAMTHQALLPNLNFSTPMKETGMQPQIRFQPGVNIDYILSNSFGFGGNCSTLIFSKTQ
ncbi:beta-ketoacyl-[acyl-carrier-protein] synthase family protein [Flavihumibacter sp.]|uniref:beta-ketoacyl-[acyl-carrier-protein] synthase family protein n=1 Tax=Flavihumibacter sp. TaxID=1913981 RepID=UPI002FC62AAB|nr:beta-ketoacyl-[acyl-carrier-protein] synthase family protein [Flavihumibacter sediminis]